MLYEFDKIFKRNSTKKEKPTVRQQNDSGAYEITKSPSGIGFTSNYVDFDRHFQSERDQILFYRGMAEHPEMDKAVTEIVDEAIVVDDPRPVGIDLSNLENVTGISDKIKKQITEQFENIVGMMNYKRDAKDLFRKWYIDGRLFFFLDIDSQHIKKGIQDIIYVDPLFIKKIKEYETTSDSEIMIDENKTREYYIYAPYDLHNTQQQRSYTTVGNFGSLTMDKHQRSYVVKIPIECIVQTTSGILDKTRTKVLSYLHKAIKPLNQLRVMEDAVVIYRITRAPERRAFYVDVGDLPPNKAKNYLDSLIRKYRNRMSYNTETGEVSSQNAVHSMQEDFWLPRRDGGKGTDIQSIQGGQNLGEIEDVQYFKEKLYQSINVPLTRMQPDDRFLLGRASEMTRDELNFTKFIKRLRTKFSSVFTAILQRQLALLNIMSVDEFNDIKNKITYIFAADEYFTQLKELEILRERLQILRDVQEYEGKYFSQEYIKKYVLMQSEEDILGMQKQMDDEKKKNDTPEEDVNINTFGNKF